MAGAVVGVAAVVASLVVATAPAQAAPFANTEPTVYLAQNSPTQLMQGSQLTGQLQFSNVGAAQTPAYNAIGYNELDNYIYGVAGTNIIRIHHNGVDEVYKPAAIGAHIGAFQTGTSRFYYSNGTRLFWTNIANPASGSTEVTLSRAFGAADFTWANGYFWGLGGGNIWRLSTTGVVSSWAGPAALASHNAGGAWTYGNGNLGFTNNATGEISQVRVTNPASATPTFTLVSVIAGPSTTNNDATASLGRPADLGLAKSFSLDRAKPGDPVSFDLTVTNNGAGVASGYTISDVLPAGLTVPAAPTGCSIAAGVLTCSGGRLDIGASFTFSVAATVATDAPRGTITNSASVLGNEQDDVAANNSANDTLQVVVPQLDIVKTGDLVDLDDDGVPDVGETIEYTFEVENSGDLDVTGVAVNDPKVSDLAPASVDLAAGESATFTASYTLTQADVDAGGVVNTATATGTDEYGDEIVSDPSSVDVDVPAAPALEAVKTAELGDANGNGAADAGETIAYSVAVRNAGNVTLTGVTVDDPIVALTPASVDLAPGDDETFTGTYTVTDADVTAGSVVNTATASGTTPGGDPIESPPTTTTTDTAQIGLTIVKSAEFADGNGNGELDLGETIVYSFVVTNTGNVRIEGITIDDAFVTGIAPASADLDGGQQAVFTSAPYTVTDEDVSTGSVSNTATASGDPIGGTPITSDPSTVTVPTVDPIAAWTLVKQAALADANGNGVADAGETIAYSFRATNTGTLTLSNVSVSDPRVTGIAPASATLIPGQFVVFTADPYQVTQADVDAGAVFNEATGSATGPNGDAVPVPPATSIVDGPDPAPGLTAVKTAELDDTNDNGVADEGETITFLVEVRNSGNVTLMDVSVDDPMAGALDPASVTLAPTESATFTSAPYTVTAADVENGSVENSATATGVPPSGEPMESPPTTTSTETVRAEMSIVKRAVLDDRDGDGVADLGETITYTFAVMNTGNTRIDNVTIDDSRVTGITPAQVDIEPGLSATFTADPYVVTEADLLAGQVRNTATATGNVPGGPEVTTPPSTTDVPPAPIETGLEIDKQGDLDDANGNGVADLGEVIAYSFVVTNTGNITVTDVTVDDPRVTGLQPATATIAPGGAAVFTAAPYVVSQADIDASEVRNAATAAGIDAAGDPIVSEPDESLIITVDPAPALVAAKEAELVDDNDNGVADAGESIEYTITLTNTGNVTLTDVSASDPMLTGLTPTVVDSLAPRASAIFTADPYVVTEADVEAGSISNSATGTGTPPTGGDPIDAPPSTVTTPTVDPGLLVTKQAALDDDNGNGMADLGERVTYSFRVQNTGNTRLEGVTVRDPKVTGIEPATATIEAGGELIMAADPYTVTEADLLAGELSNTAVASGRVPGRDDLIETPPSTVTVPPAPVAPNLAIEKTAELDDVNGNGIGDEGERIRYTIVVSNTGNVTLSDVEIVDAKLTGLTPSLVDELAPGDSVTATADPYIVTADDVRRGSVENRASAYGTAPDGSRVGGYSLIVRTATGAGLATTGAEVTPSLVAAATALLLGMATLGFVQLRRRRLARG